MTAQETYTAISLAIFRANGALGEWGNLFAAPHGLTTARWQILGAVALAQTPPNVPQIAEKMGVTRQGALKQVDILVQEGLLEALPNPAHKRSPLYRLTEHGQTLLDTISTQWQQHAQQAARHFAPADLQTTLNVLNQLHEYYRADIIHLSANHSSSPD